MIENYTVRHAAAHILKYSFDELESMKRMHNDGLTYKQIGVKFSITGERVVQLLKKHERRKQAAAADLQR